MEFSLLAAAAIAVGGFWLMLRWEARRGNAAGCALDLWDAGLMAAIGGIFVGRLTAMVQAGINPLADPGQILLVRSGVSTTGVAIGAFVVFGFVARRDLAGSMDAIAPAALAGLAGWHGGCVATAGCLGTESSLPWAMSLDGSTVTRHPVELYAALLLGIGAIGFALWKQYGRPPAMVPAGLGLVVGGGVRLITEPLRISLTGGPVILYGAAVAIGFVVAVFGFVLAKSPVPPQHQDAT
jgi:prolipoprotein diacylglyceryltransferase